MSFRQLIPRRLQFNYDKIMKSNLVSTKIPDETNLGVLQSILNESKSNSDEENSIQRTIQFLYRQNASSFYKFLTKNKMSHVILWTESKCIVRHLGLQGIVYIRWNNEEKKYEVLPHKSIANRPVQNHEEKQTSHTSIDRIVSEVNGMPEVTIENSVGSVTEPRTWSSLVKSE